MDQAMVVRAQHGDERAFETLAAEAYPRLYRLAYAILRDAPSADDATQQALVRIWQNLPRLRDASCFDGWCYRLLVNACRDQVRHSPGWMATEGVRALEPVARDEIAPIAERAAVREALSCLSLDHRTVLALRYLLDLTPDEIAAMLGVPRKTVYSRLDRAAASMRAVMEAASRPTPPGSSVPQRAAR